ncbi:MAG: ABC transporter permease [Planctomycetes bacterium]|nr:ABC transporter permease [Planctomycetota bacterium]
MMSVFKRELKSYFGTPLAYVFLAIFLGCSAYFMFRGDFFLQGEASLRVFFSNIPALFAVYAPLMAMRLWSEERRTGTIEMLLTLPITTSQAVLGKFFAAWLFMGISLLLTLPVVFTLEFLGDPEYGPIFTGYLGAFLMGGSYLAISTFFSTLTKSQVIAFVLSLVVCGGLLMVGDPAFLKIAGFLPESVNRLLASLSFTTQFDVMERGMVELRNILFMVTMTVGFLVASTVMLEDRKAA